MAENGKSKEDELTLVDRRRQAFTGIVGTPLTVAMRR